MVLETDSIVWILLAARRLYMSEFCLQLKCLSMQIQSSTLYRIFWSLLAIILIANVKHDC